MLSRILMELRRKSMRRYLILSLFILPAAGCVTSGTCHQQEEQTAAQKKRADTLSGDLEAAKKTLADAQKTNLDLTGKVKADADQLASLSTQMNSVQKSNKDLQDSLEANKGELSKKVADLVKEKD